MGEDIEAVTEGAKGRLSCSRGPVLRGRPRRAMGRSPVSVSVTIGQSFFIGQKIRKGVHFVSLGDGPAARVKPGADLAEAMVEGATSGQERNY